MELTKASASLSSTFQIGDLIRFDRGLYSHWAVYLGRCKLLVDITNDSSNYTLEKARGGQDSPDSNFYDDGAHLISSCESQKTYEFEGDQNMPRIRDQTELPTPTSFVFDESAAPCVAHFSGYSSDVDKEAKVLFLPLSQVRDYEVGRVCNQWDGELVPGGTADILHRVQQCVGTDFGGYCLVSNNCEHFATWARYGIKKCNQVHDAVSTGGSVLAGLALAAPLAGGLLAAGLVGALLSDTPRPQSDDHQQQQEQEEEEERRQRPLEKREGEEEEAIAIEDAAMSTSASIELRSSSTDQLSQENQIGYPSVPQQDRRIPELDFEPGSLQEAGLASACIVGQLAGVGVGLLGIGLSGLLDLGTQILSDDGTSRPHKATKLATTSENS